MGSADLGLLESARPGRTGRWNWRTEDRRLAADLLASAKDRAENTMIVDVLRNDLGRVCLPGSVRVPRLCRLERTSSVQHLVSTVTGQLAPGRDEFDLLGAAMPGGSITGAPKIRAMELIETLEPVGRGPYCGAAAWFDAGGAMGSSIPIRTMVADGSRITFHVGGGITWRSDADDEWEETRPRRAGRSARWGSPRKETRKRERQAWARSRAGLGSDVRAMSDVLGAGPVAWVNGAIVAVDTPALPVGDRGFQLGDAIFETLRVRRGVAIEGAEHLARLREGLATLAIGGAPNDGDLLAAIASVVAANTLADAAVRVTVSRGVPLGRGLLPAGWHDLRPNVVVQAWPHAAVEPGSDMAGVRAITSVQRRDPAHPLAATKTTSRADHVLAALEAERAGVDDALVLTVDGRVGEASTANVAAVLIDDSGRPRLVTPALDAGILAGATRAWLLGTDGAQAIGLPAGEKDLTVPGMLSAREAILCSSVAGIRALVELDGRPIGTGSPGPWARRLRDAREAWIRAVAGG